MIDEISKKVAARIFDAGLSAEDATCDTGPIDLSDHKIIACAMAERAGDAVVFMARNRGLFLFVHRWGAWLKWSTHYWAEDLNSEAVLTAVEVVVDEYRRVAGSIKERIDNEPEMDAKKRNALETDIKILTRKINELRGRRRKDVLEFVHTGRDKSMAISGDELDQTPWLLACSNGVIDLKTGKIRPGRQTDFLTCAAPTEWRGLEAQCPIFEAFMLSILGGDQEIVDYMQRMFGQMLIGKQREHVFLVLSGAKGRNGKDTLMKTLSKVLGRDLMAPVQAEMGVKDQMRSYKAAVLMRVDCPINLGCRPFLSRDVSHQLVFAWAFCRSTFYLDGCVHYCRN